MPRHTEPSANNAMGSLLEGMLSRSVVRSENTQAISGRPALQPDILVTAPGLAPVVVEAEYMPAANVEPEARSRLGLEVAANGRVIEAAIVLRYPEDVGDAHDLRAALSSIRLSYCVFTEGAEDVHRFPESGWLDGSVEDLAGMVRLVSVPQRAVNRAATALQEGIDGAVRLLDELNETRSGITMSIARRLGMTNVPQTRRMACAIIANALVFHERIAGMHEGVKPLALVCGDGVDNPQEEVLAAWRDILDINYWAIFAIARDILDINYWAIFAIARDILEQLPTPSSLRTLRLGVGDEATVTRTSAFSAALILWYRRRRGVSVCCFFRRCPSRDRSATSCFSSTFSRLSACTSCCVASRTMSRVNRSLPASMNSFVHA